MNLALIIFFGGLGIIGWIAAWSYFKHDDVMEEAIDQEFLHSVPGVSHGDALLVSRQHGKIVYINESARRWLNTNGEMPRLEQVAAMVEPANHFLELFSEERQSSFQLGERWIEASSHQIPNGPNTRTVVVMRELTSLTKSPNLLDMGLAMSVINEIGKTVNASMGIEQVPQIILSIIQKSIAFDSGEICRWDDDKQVLHQRGWVGDAMYLLDFEEYGNVYRIDEGISGWIARHKKPLLLNDPTELTGVIPKFQNKYQYQSYMAVPLFLGDEFWGTLELANKNANAYTQGELSLLQALSTPVAVATYNAEIYSEQVQRVDDLAKLQQVVSSKETTDTSSVYAALNERIAKLVGADMCGIFIYEADRNGLVPQLPFWGLPEALIQSLFIPLMNDSPQRDIWENQSYWVSNDIIDEPLVAALGLQPVVEIAGIRNTAWMPLQLRDERIGVLAVSNKWKEGGFTARDIQSLTILAAQSAIVIENARLYQREKRLDTELIGLQEITDAIGALSHETEFYGEITERIARLMDIQMCGILLYDEGRELLVSQLPFFGVENDLVKDYVINLQSRTVMAELWRDESYWFSNRVQSDTLVFEAELDQLAEKIGVQKTLMAVLYAGGQRLGVVQISNKNNGADFTNSDARLLMIFATQTAAIIQNARLYRDAQRSAVQAQGLRKVAELAGNVLTSQETFTPVLSEIATLLACEMVFVNVLDRQKGSLVTYPRWIHGVELTEPIIQDIYSPGFEEQSVVISRRPYLGNDIVHDERVLEGYRQIAKRLNIHNAIVVPLIFGDRTLGELGVANRMGGLFQIDDLQMVQAVSAQVAAALDRLLLYEETGQSLNRRLEELDSISRISNELMLTLDLDSVLEIIREEAVKSTGASDSTIVIFNDYEENKLPRINRRLGQTDTIFSLADIEKVAFENPAETITVDDYKDSELQAAPSRARSALAVTINYLDRPVGVIHLFNIDPDVFDDRASAFLMTLSAKASLGYGNSIRYREQLERSDRLRRRVEQLNSIFELGNMFQSGTDPIHILETIAFNIQQSIGFDAVVILLYDENTNVLRRVAQAGLPVTAFEESKKHTITRSSVGNLLNPTYRISDSHFFPIEKVQDWFDEKIVALSTKFDGNRTLPPLSGKVYWRDGDMLVVTFYNSSGEILGVMSLDRPHDNHRPDRGVIEVLEIFANQAATMIENTRLYLSTVRNAEQEARINEIMEAVASTLDIADIVRAVAEGAMRMLPLTRMTLALQGTGGSGYDLLKVVIAFDGSLDIVHEKRDSLANTAMEATINEGIDYIYRQGETAVERYDDLSDWYKQGEKISLILPLFTGGECLGALHIGSDLQEAFGFVEYRPLLKRMTQIVAAAVQNARLFLQAVNLQVLNESVVESIQQGIVVLDKSGNIISSNDFMQSRFGWGSEVIGKEFTFFQQELGDLIGDELWKVLDQGIPQEKINARANVGGEDIITNFYMYPLRYEDAIRGAVILVEDITSHTQLEQAMEIRANQLAALTEVSNRITSSLERNEVVQLALDEMGLLIDHDEMSLWRRTGSYMSLEGSTIKAIASKDDEMRFLIADYADIQQIISTQHVVVDSDVEVPLHGIIKSWIGVPLVNHGHVVGLMMLTSEKVNAYDGVSDQNIALAFASQVAIAEANADLFEQTFDRTNELGTLLEAAQATSLAKDLDTVFQIIVELMFGALDMDNCAIMLWHEVENTLEVQLHIDRGGATDTIMERGSRISLDNYPAKLRALNDRDVTLIMKNVSEDLYPREVQELVDNGNNVRMLVPLVVREKAMGLIQLEQNSSDIAVSQQKVRLARALGAQVSIAIENARLSAETTSHFEESLIINELSQAISSTLNLEDMITIVGEQLPAVAGASEIYVALYDADTEEITFPLAVNQNGRYQIEPRKLNTDEVSFIIRHRRPLNLGADYYGPDELRRSLGIVNGEGDAKSYLGIPLIAGDQIYGVLAVRDTQRTRAFSMNEQRILNTVGTQLGVAIQNARLYAQIQKAAEELNLQVSERTAELEEERDRIDTLYQITSELARTLDKERLMTSALTMVAKSVNATDGAILQLDPMSDQLYCGAWIDPDMLQQTEDSEHPIHPAEQIARWLLTEDEPDARIDDLHQEDFWDPEYSPQARSWRSALAVVLEANEEILGVMVLLDSHVNAFRESQLRLMVAAANQVASSINNAELYKLIRNQAERLGSLLRAEQEGAEKNRAILEGIADGVILADAEGRIVMFNTAAERILEVPREQAMNRTLDQLTGLDISEAAAWSKALVMQLDHLSDDTASEFLDERIKIGDRTVSVHLSQVSTNDRFLGTVSVFRDITREVLAEQSKSEFIASVSHEFRTPLTSIKGYNDLLLMGAAGEFTDMQQSMLGTIRDNVTRLTDLVEDVLKIANMDAGREILNIDHVDLNNVVNRVLADLGTKPQHQNRDITVNFDPLLDIPTIEADTEKMFLILHNLIDNAFNYTREGGAITIGVMPNADDENYMLISVQDTGVGIPDEFKDRIWRRFERYEPTALELDVAGTGLGLPIVKEIVELHSGKIRFESEVGVGTTFFVSLPLRQPHYMTRTPGGRSN